MHNQVLVSISHCVANAAEEFEPLGNVQLLLVRPPVNRLPLPGAAAIDQAGDVRLIERGQNLALAAEPLEDFRAAAAGRTSLMATCLR